MPGETLEQAGGARAPGAPQLPLPLLRLNRGARPSQACAGDDSTLQHIAALALLVPTPPPLPTTVHPAAVVQRKSRCPASAPANGNSFQLHLPPRSPPPEAPPPAASQPRGHASQPRGHASQRPRLPKLCLSKAPPPASQKPRLPAPNLEPGAGVQGRAAARGREVLRPEPRPASRPPQRASSRDAATCAPIGFNEEKQSHW